MASQVMEYVRNGAPGECDFVDAASEQIKTFRETRLSTVRPFSEFVDYHRISVPRDTNEATQVCARATACLTTAHYV